MIRRPPISTLTESLYPCTTFHPISLLSSLARYRSSSLPAQARRAESPLGPVLSAECWPPLCWEFSSFRSSICRSAAGLVRNGLLPPVRRDRSPIMRKVLALTRSEEHTSELQSLMRISYAVFCLKNKKTEI